MTTADTQRAVVDAAATAYRQGEIDTMHWVLSMLRAGMNPMEIRSAVRWRFDGLRLESGAS